MGHSRDATLRILAPRCKPEVWCSLALPCWPGLARLAGLVQAGCPDLLLWVPGLEVSKSDIDVAICVRSAVSSLPQQEHLGAAVA
jgi:hypothetical protein